MFPNFTESQQSKESDGVCRFGVFDIFYKLYNYIIDLARAFHREGGHTLGNGMEGLKHNKKLVDINTSIKLFTSIKLSILSILGISKFGTYSISKLFNKKIELYMNRNIYNSIK